MKLSYLFLLIGVLLCNAGNAQLLITGKVTSKNTPISDVNINITGSKSHAHTDKDGNFSLEVTAETAELLFSHLLFETKSISVSKSSALNVELTRKFVLLEDVQVSSEVNPMDVILKSELLTTPIQSSQDILQKVPGLFIGQHAGGGKAEQIFLRGFDIDHGTDIALTFDGMPINMVSHAHGQGYADMHFIIPEVIEDIRFGKGAYYADKGNFNTAGFVDFGSKRALQSNLIKLEAGQFDSYRLLGMFNLVNNSKESAYVAAEFIQRDGFFQSSQNFGRTNLFAKYSKILDNGNNLSVSASFFDSEWTASGQIPQRAVDSGLIGRFGAIDDTEGGRTGRSNLNLEYTHFISDFTYVKSSAFLSQYDFELYSNFTFFLNDSINGDQIKQKEDRLMTGLNSTLYHQFKDSNFKLISGISLRNDQVEGNQLARTLNRSTVLGNEALGDVNETNACAFATLNYTTKKWTISPGIRADYFNFIYEDQLDSLFNINSNSQVLASPKFSVSYNASKNLTLAVKSGFGFHSNDSRVSVLDTRNTLPVSKGADFEVNWKPAKKLFINAAAWYLFLEQEFVYVGDAGVVEPSGKTQRQGVDLSVRYQIKDWLFLNGDVNYTMARGEEDSEYSLYIPLAPELTSAGGISAIQPIGFHASINYRFLGDRAANEDNSIIAEGYFILDATAGYTWKNIDLNLTVENVLDSDWNETQFATESRLFFEDEPVEEIHFTPGTPFFLNTQLSFRF
ncbi:MAG: TonB-dependent receptor [Flavobacteriales bacterium]